MPALSPTMTSGTLTKWHVKPGQKLSAGDVLCSVQTDKAVVDMDTQEDMIFGRVLIQEGTEDVKLGEVIALVCDDEADLNDMDSYEVPKSESSPSEEAPAEEVPQKQAHAEQTPPQTQASQKPTSDFKYMDPPSVRSFLETYNIDRTQIPTASGKGGRITKQDVVQFQQTDAFKNIAQKKKPATAAEGKKATETKPAPAARPQAGATYTDIPATPTRKIIASRLLESKQQLPHFFMSTEARIDKLLAYREHLKQQNVKASLNDFIIKMSARALEQVPQCNATFNSKTGQHEQQSQIDISIAVATEGGLITPIVKSANTKPVPQIAATVKDLATRARSGGLKPEEFQGGTFCISNLGMFGIKNFEAVINPPHALILSVGGSEKRPYLETQQEGNDQYGFSQSFDLSVLDNVDPEALNSGNGELKTATFVTLTVSADARAVDGQDVAQYLGVLKDLLEMRSYV